MPNKVTRFRTIKRRGFRSELKVARKEKKTVELLHLHIRILSFLGLLTPRNDGSKWKKCFQYLFPRYMAFTGLYQGVFLSFGDAYVSRNDTSAMCLSMIIGLTSLMMVVKMLTISLQAEKILVFSKNLEEIRKVHNNMNHKYQRDIMSRTRLLCARLTLGYIGFLSFFVVMFFAILLPQVVPQRKQFLRGWYFYDVTASPNYESTLILSAFFGFNAVTLIGVCDSLTLVMTIHIVAQYRILRHKLSNLYLSAMQVVQHRSQKKHVTKLKQETKWHGTRLNTNKELKCLEKQVTNKFIVSERYNTKQMRIQNGLGNYFTDEVTVDERQVNKEMESQLADCIQHHVALLRCVQDEFEIFNASFLFQMLYCLADSFVLHFATKADKVDGNLIGLIGAVIAGASNLYINCWLGNKITEENVLVGDALYSCNWLLSSNSVKQSMRIIISVTNKPLVLTTSGGIPLTVETFSTVMNKAYSFFTTFR